MSLLKENTARRIQENGKSRVIKQIPSGNTARNLACYNGKTIIGWPIHHCRRSESKHHSQENLTTNWSKISTRKQKQEDVLNIQEQEESNPEIEHWSEITIHNNAFVLESQKTT